MFLLTLSPVNLSFIPFPITINLHLTDSGYQINDLESNDVTTFASDSSQWTVTPLDPTATLVYSNSCNVLLLGGYLILQNNGYYQRQYTGLPSHQSIRISILFWFIDRWETNDKMNIKLWDSNTGTVAFDGVALQVNDAQTGWSNSLCGYAATQSADLPNIVVLINFPHTGSVLDIQIKNYVGVSGLNRGSNGFRDVKIALSQDTVASTSICTNAPTSSLQAGYGCDCPTKQYAAPACTVCEAACDNCFGPGTSSCYSCATGYASDGNSCVLTASSPSAPSTTTVEVVKESAVSRASSGVAKAANLSLMIVSVASLTNPAAILMGILAKLFSYIKYLSIGYSPGLEEALRNWSSNFISLDFDVTMSSDLEDESTYRSLPAKFVEYEVSPRFLVNLWSQIFPLMVALGILGIFFALEKYFSYKKKTFRFSYMLKNVRMASQNFVLIFFYDSFGDFFLYSILEYRSIQKITSMTRLSLFVSSLFLLCGIFITIIHLKMLIQQEKVRKKTHALNLDEFLKENENIEVLFSEFKDRTFVQQAFPLFVLARNIFFNLILVTLFGHPLTQTILLLLGNLIMYVYLIFKRPLRERLDNIQQFLAEFCLIVVSVSILVMAALDTQNKSATSARYHLGNLIIAMNFLFNILVIIFLLSKIFIWAREFYLERKARKVTSPVIALDQTSQMDSTINNLGLEKTIINETIDLKTCSNNNQDFDSKTSVSSPQARLSKGLHNKNTIDKPEDDGSPVAVDKNQNMNIVDEGARAEEKQKPEEKEESSKDSKSSFKSGIQMYIGMPTILQKKKSREKYLDKGNKAAKVFMPSAQIIARTSYSVDSREKAITPFESLHFQPGGLSEYGLKSPAKRHKKKRQNQQSVFSGEELTNQGLSGVWGEANKYNF